MSKSFALQNTPADHRVFRAHETSESNHWNRNFLKPISSRGQFNKTFTSVIYKCSYLFSDSKTMATLVNYTCKSFIKLAPDKFKAPSTRIRVKKNIRIRRVDAAKTWLWLNWFGRIIAVLIYKENKIETGIIERRFYFYFCFQEWSICHIYNKILFLTSLCSGRLEVVGTRKNERVCAHYLLLSSVCYAGYFLKNVRRPVGFIRRHHELEHDCSFILREPAARHLEWDNWWQPRKFAQLISSSKDHRSMVTAESLLQSSLL